MGFVISRVLWRCCSCKYRLRRPSGVHLWFWTILDDSEWCASLWELKKMRACRSCSQFVILLACFCFLLVALACCASLLLASCGHRKCWAKKWRISGFQKSTLSLFKNRKSEPIMCAEWLGVLFPLSHSDLVQICLLWMCLAFAGFCFLWSPKVLSKKVENLRVSKKHAFFI